MKKYRVTLSYDSNEVCEYGFYTEKERTFFIDNVINPMLTKGYTFLLWEL